jgi:hypothetical protein
VRGVELTAVVGGVPSTHARAPCKVHTGGGVPVEVSTRDRGRRSPIRPAVAVRPESYEQREWWDSLIVRGVGDVC